MVIAIDARLAGGTSTGDSSYWTGLLHGLASVADDNRYLLFSNAERPAGIPDDPRFQWIRLVANHPRWWSLVSMPLAARRLKAQATHVQYNVSPLASQAITTIHDVSFFIGPEWFQPRDLNLLRRFVPYSAKKAKRVITVSETSKAEIEKYVPAARGKTRVTYNACPLHIQPVEQERARKLVAAEFGLTNSYALTVGTRWPRKNVQLAIDAAAATNLPLALTGKTGWGAEELGRNARALGYVTAEQLSALYSAATLYLCPSFHEGFGLPLLESFACGCPVICGCGGALPEVAGDAAYIMDSYETSDWAAGIRTLLASSGKLDDLKRRGFERLKRFNWADTALKTLAVYREVMEISR